MRSMPHHYQRATRRAFTLVELLVTIAIIAVLLFLGTTIYHKAADDSREKLAKVNLTALAGAVQVFHQERQDYPQMRLTDIDPAWTVPATAVLSNDLQSIEALVYCLQYRSGAGSALSSLPANVLRQVNSLQTVTDAGQNRPLLAVLDPWGHPIQYLRPREDPSGPNYPWSAHRLNNRVLLISMGPDGVPGNAKDPANQPLREDPVGGGVYYPNPAALLGTGDDIVVQVGAIR